MKMMVSGFGLVLLVVVLFGEQPGSSDAFSLASPKSPSALSDKESWADIFTGLRPSTPDTSELDTADLTDLTETAEIKHWHCHRHYCHVCFHIGHRKFCIIVITRKPTGFYASATVNAKQFIHKAITAPGFAYADTKTVPGYKEIQYFDVGFFKINIRLRSATCYVAYTINGKSHLIALGHFQIPANYQSQEAETLTSMVDQQLLTQDTSELQETSETHEDTTDLTETAETNNWVCHHPYCYKCFVFLHHRFCIVVVHRSPTGFYAAATVNGHRFLFKAFTAHGFGYADTRHVPGLPEIQYFEMAFAHINPRLRSATSYVAFKIHGRTHIIRLGTFRVATNYLSQEGDNLKFTNEASILDEAIEAAQQENE